MMATKFHVWLVKFNDGSKLTYLSDQCATVSEAKEALIERFGNKFHEVNERKDTNINSNNQELK